MSERNHRQPSLDPLIEGYLDYLLDVARKAAGTVRDVRCTLRRVSEAMERLAPDRPLWKLELLDYLRWIERERQAGRVGAGLNKNLSHLRGFLDYACAAAAPTVTCWTIFRSRMTASERNQSRSA